MSLAGTDLMSRMVPVARVTKEALVRLFINTFFFLGNTIDLCYLPTDLVFLYLCAYQGGLEVCDLFKHLPRAGTVR